MSLLEPTFRINNKDQSIKSPLFPHDTHNPKNLSIQALYIIKNHNLLLPFLLRIVNTLTIDILLFVDSQVSQNFLDLSSFFFY